MPKPRKLAGSECPREICGGGGLLKNKLFTPWGVGPVPAARFGGLDGGGQGSENCFMFGIHIWIPHEILSILSTHTWGTNKTLPPTKCKEKISSAFGTKFGPNVVGTF